MRSPCDPRCPNAPEPPAVHTCKDCGEGIVPGDEFAEINGEYYHIECLENITTRELLAFVDFHGNRNEVSAAFHYRIYDMEMLGRLKERVGIFLTAGEDDV